MGLNSPTAGIFQQPDWPCVDWAPTRLRHMAVYDSTQETQRWASSNYVCTMPCEMPLNALDLDLWRFVTHLTFEDLGSVDEW